MKSLILPKIPVARKNHHAVSTKIEEDERVSEASIINNEDNISSAS